MLEVLCEQPFIEKVLVMPDNVPPHKTCDFLAADEHRIEMCRIACEDFSKAELCLVEFEREGKSYTVDTVARLRKLYPAKRLAVVCGGDMIATLDTWRDYKRLFSLVSFIAFSRKGVNGFEADVERMRALGADITVIDADIPEISSTQLRAGEKAGFIPEKIADYIKENGVYDDR